MGATTMGPDTGTVDGLLKRQRRIEGKEEGENERCQIRGVSSISLWGF